MTFYYQPYWDNIDELEHHGILGQKWGVRRYQNADGSLTESGKKRYTRPSRDERKETRVLKRQTAAAIKNLVEKGKTYADAEFDIYDAKENYKNVSKKMYFFKADRLKSIKEASEKLTKAFEMAETPRAERVRAIEIYNDAAKKLLDNNKKMIEKYGSDTVKELGEKQIFMGQRLKSKGWLVDEYEMFATNVLNTGLTVVNIPWYGQRYTGKYIGEKELEIREREFEKETKKKF